MLGLPGSAAAFGDPDPKKDEKAERGDPDGTRDAESGDGTSKSRSRDAEVIPVIAKSDTWSSRRSPRGCCCLFDMLLLVGAGGWCSEACSAQQSGDDAFFFGEGAVVL